MSSPYITSRVLILIDVGAESESGAPGKGGMHL